MGQKSKIEWTDTTWNPIRGCSRISPGCGGSDGGGCYAEKLAHRFSGPDQPYEGLTRMTARGPRWTGKITLVPELLKQPLHWKQPQRIFVNSMSDLFHEKVPDEFIDRVFAVMAMAKQHTFQVLTKRPERMRQYINTADGREMTMESFTWPLPNVWLGVSIENQEAAGERIPLLLQTPAAVRFLSIEPLLEYIDLGRAFPCGYYCDETVGHVDHPFWSRVNPSIDQVIVGGESGPNARPMHVDWVRSIREQCVTAGVPFFFKQWGEYIPEGHIWNDPMAEDPTVLNPEADAKLNSFKKLEALAYQWPDTTFSYRVGKRDAGCILDGKVWHQFPETNKVIL